MADTISTTNQAPVNNGSIPNAPTGETEGINPQQLARKPNLDSDYARRFASLSSKESHLRRMEQELQRDREELTRYRSLREKAKLQPSAVLSEYGLSYGDVTARMLEGEHDDKYQTIEQRIAAIENESRNKATIEKQREQDEIYHKAISHLQNFVDNAGDEFEYIKINNAYDEVLEFATLYFKETGRYIKFDEAARHVEKHLESQAEKLAQSKKLQAKFFPKSEEKTDEQRIEPSTKTLSNEGSSSSSPGDDTLDEKVLMQRAIAVMKSGRRPT